MAAANFPGDTRPGDGATKGDDSSITVGFGLHEPERSERAGEGECLIRPTGPALAEGEVGLDPPERTGFRLPPERATGAGSAGADSDASGIVAGSPADFTVDLGPTSHGEPGPHSSMGQAQPPPTIEGPGSLIGPYKLLQLIGEGGMGAVYMAEQERPVRRRVALKIIKPGMDSAQVIARFEVERQALAMMDHQSIARVLDAGTTETGRPYFVMELVHGIPMTDYCDKTQLTPRERLELFIPACQAIEHAHQKGIIHRDIKPSNILVTLYDGKPVPKVIDFGIAKATEQRLTERTMFTEYGSIVGTLEYMSPEQAEMSALGIDTRSDIYSLGVLLYELLTGGTPLERSRLPKAGYVEILRRIKEEEPPKPSTRLSSSGDRLAALSTQRKTEASKLSKLMRGELDWIVMKALEKDRTRRYETASGFARDIQRFLAGDAVEACPPTAVYRLRKFARKHRAALATASAFAGLLVVAATLSTWQAIRATRAEHRALLDARRANAAEEKSRVERDKAVAAGEKAERSAAEARSVLSFFQDQVLAAARPLGQEGGLGKDVTVRQAFDAAEPKIGAAFRDQPTVEASVRSVLGTTYYYLGDLPLAIRQHERALEIRRTQLGPDHSDTLASQNRLASAYHATGQREQAIALYERTLAAQAAKLGPDHLDTLSTQKSVANVYWAIGQLERAIVLYERTQAALAAQLGPDHPETLFTQNSLGLAYRSAGQFDRAVQLFERTLAGRTFKLGPDHPETLFTQNSLAQACRSAGQVERSIALHERTLAAQASKIGPDHPHTLVTQNSLAMAFRDAGQLERAIALHERTLAAQASKIGPDHPNTLYTQSTLATAYSDAGQLDRAIPLFEQTLEARKVRIGPTHPDTLTTQSGLAAAYQEAGQLERAIVLYERTLAAQEAKLGPDHPDTLLSQNHLARAYEQAGDEVRAELLFREVLERRRKKLGAEHPDVAATLLDLGRNLIRRKKSVDTEPLLRACVAIHEKKLPGHWRRFYAQGLLGSSLLSQQKYAEAEPLLLTGYEGMKTLEDRIPAPLKKLLSEAGARVGQLYEAWGKPDKATAWQARLASTTAQAETNP